jgi:hypothetical protein
MSNVSIHESVLIGLQKVGYEHFRAIKDSKGNVYVSGIEGPENPIFSTYRIDYALVNLDEQGWFDIKERGGK